jgi:hypothetical protein
MLQYFIAGGTDVLQFLTKVNSNKTQNLTLTEAVSLQ